MRTLTIEEMIKNGASWQEISARVKELQNEEAARKAEERKRQLEQEQKARKVNVAKERMVAAFADWCVAEGFMKEEDRQEFIAEVGESVEAIANELKQAYIFQALLRR